MLVVCTIFRQTNQFCRGPEIWRCRSASPRAARGSRIAWTALSASRLRRRPLLLPRQTRGRQGDESSLRSRVFVRVSFRVFARLSLRE